MVLLLSGIGRLQQSRTLDAGLKEIQGLEKAGREPGRYG